MSKADFILGTRPSAPRCFGSWWNLIGATGASLLVADGNPSVLSRRVRGVFRSCNEDSNLPAIVFSPLSASFVPEPWTGSDAGSANAFHSRASCLCFLSLPFFHDVKKIKQKTAIKNMSKLASST